MTRFEMRLTRPDIGRRQMVTRQASAAAAVERAGGAYPGCTVIECRELPAAEAERVWAKPAAKALAASAAAAGERHRENLARCFDAIPEEGGISTAELSFDLGVATISARKWAAELAREGKVVREKVNNSGKLIIRRADNMEAPT